MTDERGEVIEYLPDTFAQPPYPIQPNSQSDEVYSDLMREERIANIISQLNPDNILEEIEYRLKGCKRNRMTGTWVKIDPNAPEIPAKLISNFMSFLSSILNNNTTFSNFKSIDINKIMGLIIEYIVDDLSSNAEAYGLHENYTDRTKIGMIVCGTCYTCFKRALEGSEARRFFAALKVVENQMQNQQSKKHFLDHFKLWG